jgi:UDP-glucuronate 4-epimerase
MTALNTILVTGCAGFIGSHLCERLLNEGAEVIGVDMFTANYDRWIKEHNLQHLRGASGFTFLEQDLRQTDFTQLLHDVDGVFHLAALPGVRTSWGRQFEEYVEHNILVTQRLLEAVRHSGGVRRMAYASSSSVYGGMNGPTDEARTPAPFSPYGVTKLGGEQLCQLYSQNFGVPVVSLRYFTVFGPRQRPDMAFHKFILNILQDRPITVYGDGEQSRDFTYVADATEGNVRALLSQESGEVFNIGGRSRLTVNEVIRLIETHTGKIARVDSLPEQPGDPRHTWADISKARTWIGYDPQHDFEQGLALQIADLRRLYNL